MTQVILKHFLPSEFQGWYTRMNPRLLQSLDSIRESWGHPIEISPAHGALGRYDGPADTSGHNVDKWESVLACDIFVRGLRTPRDVTRFVALCKSEGILGVGFYPDWKHPNPEYTCGFHLDIKPGSWRTWSALRVGRKQQYFAFIYGYDIWVKRHFA